MERTLPALLGVMSVVVACSETSIAQRPMDNGPATGGTPAANADGSLGSGSASAESGITAHCDCPPVTLATDQQFAGEIALDATSAYWLVREVPGSPLNASVMKVPLTGGTPVPVASAQPDLLNVAVDRTSVYWATFDAIRKAPIAGGPWIELALEILPLDAPKFALDATTIYWTSWFNRRDCAIYKAPIGGGDPARPDGGGRVRLATVYGGGCSAIAVDDTHAYWLSGVDTVMKVPIAGGAATPLVQGREADFSSEFIAVGHDHVYWTQFYRVQRESGPGGDLRGVLLSVPVGGGVPVELASRPGWPRGFAFDGTQIFWGTTSTLVANGVGSGTDGEILKTTQAGVTAIVAEGVQGLGGIATNGTDVCWTDATAEILGRAGTVKCLIGGCGNCR